jgi:hypothetical protein
MRHSQRFIKVLSNIRKGELMRKIKRILTLTLVALFAYNCVGTSGANFERVEEDTISLGLSTYGDIVTRMGDSFEEDVYIKNNKKFKLIGYTYSSTGGVATSRRAIATRHQMFYFYQNILVGHEFISSWEEDHTNFDETKVNQIIKEESTKEDVMSLLGKPSGKLIYPLSKNKGTEVLLYSFYEGRQYAYSIEFFQKNLHIECDQTGTVTEIEYTETGNKLK